MLKDFIMGETDADFLLTYVRAKADDTLSGLMTNGFTSDMQKRVFSLLRDSKESKPQLKLNKAFDRFTDTLLSKGEVGITKLLSKLSDQAMLSLAKDPA